MRVSFADCTFDSDTRELSRSGAVVHISPKAFRLLELLLESRPRAISKKELQDKLWPRTFVSEANLASLAAEARRAIGDPARGSKLLRTVYGFGYAFSGETSPVGTPAPTSEKSRFSLARDGEEIPLAPGENLLGRDPLAAVRIDDSTVSRRHALIRVGGGGASIEDLASKNGTFVNGRQAGKDPVLLSDGSEVQVGSVFLAFRDVSPQKSTRTLKGRRPR
jgi:DNA-binding winged helix-turn-helix (wHTH) protein